MTQLSCWSVLMQGTVRMQASLSRAAVPELGAETPGPGALEPALAAGRETLCLLVSTPATSGCVMRAVIGKKPGQCCHNQRSSAVGSVCVQERVKVDDGLSFALQQALALISLCRNSHTCHAKL